MFAKMPQNPEINTAPGSITWPAAKPARKIKTKIDARIQ